MPIRPSFILHMLISLPQKSKTETVEMNADEFDAVYSGVKQCLLEEFDITESAHILDGQALLQFCRSQLKKMKNHPRYFDFQYGFLPLFERLTCALSNYKGDDLKGDHRLYKIEF